MTTEEKLDRLTGIVETLAGSIAAHDNKIEAHDRQIEALIELASTQQKVAEQHSQQIANLEKQWQAYLNTLPRS
jgi:uncharacterized protein (DUF3084 family)